jgi:hypothetical protein
MGKTRVQTRVEPDTLERIEEYCDERDIGESAAVRRLIHSGLAKEGYPVTASNGGILHGLARRSTILLGALLLTTGALGLGVALTVTGPATAAATVLGVIGVALGTLTIWTATLAQLALEEPAREIVAPTEEAEPA